MRTGTPNFMGIKLTQARKLRRKNISTLAEEIGLTRASISAYEKDARTPSPEVMEEICKNLSVPFDFFIESPNSIAESQGPIFYRSYSSVSKLARDAAQSRNEILALIFDYLSQFVDFPVPNIPKFDIPSDPTALDEIEIEKIAEKTRTFWGLSLGPISDLICLLENNGVLIGKFPFKCRELDAFSQRIGRQFQIVIGSDKGSCVRQRFDVAHELGHILLHHKVPKKLIEDDSCLKLIEFQANYFAFEFLFPSKAFKSEVRRLSLNEFMRLKRKWKVSIASQVKRASRPDIASPSELAPLQRAISRKGWKTEEPYDDEFACEDPRLLKDAFELILESGVQTPKDISNAINLYFSDIEEIAGLPEGYLSSFGTGTVIQLRKEFQTPEIIAERSQSDSESTSLPDEKKSPVAVKDFIKAFNRKQEFEKLRN